MTNLNEFSPVLRGAIESAVRRTGMIQGGLLASLCLLYSLLPGTILVAFVANAVRLLEGEKSLLSLVLGVLLCVVTLVPLFFLCRLSWRFLGEVNSPMSSPFAQALLQPETIDAWELVEARTPYGTTVVIRLWVGQKLYYVRLGRNPVTDQPIARHLSQTAGEPGAPVKRPKPWYLSPHALFTVMVVLLGGIAIAVVKSR